MRSTPPPARRRRRAARHGLLPAVAALVDNSTVLEPDHVLVFVEAPLCPEVSVGTKTIAAAIHPFEVLAGFRAPDSWSAFGIRVRGLAHHLDDPSSPAPQATAVTFLTDREGAESSLMRTGDEVTELPGPALGTIPDLCRRVLGRATEPPPFSPSALWTCVWLDGVLEAWGDPSQQCRLASGWGQLAVLHPAVATGARPSDFDDPASLIAAARAHAAQSSWSDLRAAPEPLTLPAGPLDRDVARWMDDGFFARWTVGAFPSPATVVTDLREMLGNRVGSDLTRVVVALLE